MAMLLRRLLLSCLPLFLGGCSFGPYLVQNITGAPLEYLGECRLKFMMRRQAEAAWDEVAANNADTPFSHAYVKGFRDGFVDYADSNGNGEPPAIPPRCYRYPVLRTPEQQQDIVDWYAGFRHGAAVAADYHWRDSVVVPIARPPLHPHSGFREEIIPSVSQPAPDQPATRSAPAAEVPQTRGVTLGMPIPIEVDEAVVRDQLALGRGM